MGKQTLTLPFLSERIEDEELILGSNILSNFW